MKVNCQFCGWLFTMPKHHRAPSQACDRCWLEINAQLSQQHDPDFVGDVKSLPGYVELPWIIQ